MKNNFRNFAKFLTYFVILIQLSFISNMTVAADVEYLNSPAVESLGLPFSEAVRVDDTVYLSGQVGNLPGTFKLIDGGIKTETKQTLENISATLERHGASLQELVKCTIFLADIKEWPQMNEVYKTFFSEHYPARSAIAGSGLALDARVEIECIAVLKN
jgi:2-iminobutanoate/2-iminopropanoate deaminase